MAPSTVRGVRGIKIGSAPVTDFPKPENGDAFGSDGVLDSSDARFEVLGSPYSLLSVSLSASQKLYTRRGTLVSVAGKLENAQSTLSLLTPLQRGALGIPFLYQRITSTTPLTLLIGTKAASTTIFTLHLDGKTDWVVAQRNALLAWTGHTLTVTPKRQTFGTPAVGAGVGMPALNNWGSSFLTGRGLAALSAPGYIYPVTLAAGEELAVHPSHIVAYSTSGTDLTPQAFRFREGGAAAAANAVTDVVTKAASNVAASVSATVARLHLQTPSTPSSSPSSPSVPAAVPQSLVGYWEKMTQTAAYKLAIQYLFEARTLLRQTIWGDRLFVRVRGPTTLLLSSRGVRVSEALSRDQVNEIADTEAGVVATAVAAVQPGAKQENVAPAPVAPAPAVTPATPAPASAAAIQVNKTEKKDGKVTLTESKDLKDFVR